MCGPLAMAVHHSKGVRGWSSWISSLLYNTGRTIGYILLGLLFGLVGSMVAFSGMQRVVSILLGIILILFFVFSIQPDQAIAKVSFLKTTYQWVSRTLRELLKKSKKVPSIVLGVVNGFLPCGLVYIAIVGALSLGNVWGSMGFMLFFGLGTFPGMITVMVGHQPLQKKLGVSFRKVYPYITLFMGLYLVYRGWMYKLPLELNFFEALKNPVMCH